MAVLDDPQRTFLASDLVQLETLPGPRHRGHVHEEKFLNEFFASAQVLPTMPATIQSALELAASYGLGPIDACLAQRAIEAHADEFVSMEKPTKPMFKIAAATMFRSLLK
jgi:hypothetical protein